MGIWVLLIDFKNIEMYMTHVTYFYNQENYHYHIVTATSINFLNLIVAKCFSVEKQ